MSLQAGIRGKATVTTGRDRASIVRIAMKKAMENYIRRMISYVTTTSVIPEVSGKLKASAFPHIQKSAAHGLGFNAFYGFGDAEVVYASDLEFGTAPHMPPVSEILKWVLMKPVAFANLTPLETAWAIAMGINKRGTRAHPYFQDGVRKMRTVLREEFIREFASAGVKMKVYIP